MTGCAPEEQRYFRVAGFVKSNIGGLYRPKVARKAHQCLIYAIDFGVEMAVVMNVLHFLVTPITTGLQGMNISLVFALR